MKREEGALEVWLKGEKDVLVGWLKQRAPFDHQLINLEFERVDDDGVSDVRHFLLTTRAVDRDHAMTLSQGTGRGSWYAKNIPLGAKHQYLVHRNIDRYSWKVLLVDMADYEEVFDFPEFEPFEPVKKKNPFEGPSWPLGGALSEIANIHGFRGEFECVWPVDKADALRRHAEDALRYATTTTSIEITNEASKMTALDAKQFKKIKDDMQRKIEDAFMGRSRGY